MFGNKNRKFLEKDQVKFECIISGPLSSLESLQGKIK